MSQHILVTGGTGFIGSALLPALCERGHRVTVLTRQSRPNLPNGVAAVQGLEAIDTPVDAVINLAGASLAGKRWSDDYKREIIASRVDFTERLVDWMRRQAKPPKTLLSGSAIGFYGFSDSRGFSETDGGGEGFSAELCRRWEQAARAAEAFGTRVLLLRLGVVLDRSDGALTQMMQSFHVGVGSWVGHGRQWLSWVHRADVVDALCLLLERDDVDGPINVTAPGAVSHREFCDALAARKRVLFKMGVPAGLLRLMVGEMADELLLNGQRVKPVALTRLEYRFRFPSIESALVDILAR